MNLRFPQLCCFAALLVSAGSAFAQRPQGTDTNMTEVVTVGTDLVGLADPLVSGNGTRILRSTDGGDTYTQLFQMGTGDVLNGLGVNGQKVMAVGESGFVRFSDFSVDPTIWTERNTPAGLAGPFQAVDANPGTGTWIATGHMTIRTTDDGMTWVEEDNPADDQRTVLHVGSGVWLTGGGDFFGASIQRSTDDGLTWSSVTGLPSGAEVILALEVDSSGNVLAVGEWGTIMISTDQGASFSVIGEVNLSEDVVDVVSTGADTWVLGLEGGSLFSLTTSGTPSGSLLFEQQVGSDSNVDALTVLDGAVVMAGTESVAAPVITGDPADFNNPAGSVEITLTSSDTVYYTTDGSAPDDTDTLYSAPFDVSSSLTVKAVAESGGIYSAVVSQAVTAASPIELSISVSGSDLIITTDTSASGTSVQLQSNTDLTNAGGWTNVQAAQNGTGASLQWTITPIPTGPIFYRATVTEL